MEYKNIIAYGLKTRTWDFDEVRGYGCAECCTGDRCDEDCDAPYKGRRKSCPHCKGHGRIPKSEVTLDYNDEWNKITWKYVEYCTKNNIDGNRTDYLMNWLVENYNAPSVRVLPVELKH